MILAQSDVLQGITLNSVKGNYLTDREENNPLRGMLGFSLPAY